MTKKMWLSHPEKNMGTIKHKTAFIIIGVSIAIFAIGVFMLYVLGLNTLEESLGKEYTGIAQLLLNNAIGALDSEVEDAKVYTERLLWIDAIKNVNLKYSSMSKEEIDRYMADMDKRWMTEEKGSPLFMEYLQNRISISMRDIVATRGSVAELFITDKFGGVVAVSGKTTDFYQADEDWWQKAYNNGKGDIYVGNEEFDSSTGKWVINISVPMQDQDGTIVGICKDCVNIERIFGGFKNFAIGKTGYALIIDNKGRIIYHGDGSSINNEFFNSKEVNELLSKKKHFVFLPKTRLNNRRMFIAFAEGKSSYLSDKTTSWIALVIQDASEMSRPLDLFVLQLIAVTGLILILVIPIGIFFGAMITKPITDLSTAIERIMSGDWDYKINIKTGDEIEDFANKFSLLIANIKNKQAELMKSKDELANLSHSLEVKVTERTKELANSQDAALNVLEDLQEVKESLEKTNKELTKLDQLKSDFISTVSHELRTPLSIIKEGISLILDKIAGAINEKQQNILTISKSNIDRLSRIIDNLLDISKIEAGKVELSMGLIDISDIIKQTASSFEAKIKTKGLDLKLDVDRLAGKVYADPDKITQVLINLIGNAIKFTQKGYIEITCKDKQDSVVCSVSDTGVGISREDLPKVFTKFQQFGRTVGAGEKGTGLGLSIAKGIIDMHHGSIEVKSESGKGTTFTFVLRKYAEGALFEEYVNKAIKHAMQNNSQMSIITILMNAADKDEVIALRKKIHDLSAESAKLIKKSLVKDADEVIKDNGNMMVVLSECNKSGVVSVKDRIRDILIKYLKQQMIDDKIDLKFGYSTYPDDATKGKELIEKAGSRVPAQVKA